MHRIALFAAVMLAAAAPAIAHHGWGSYDAENPMTLTAPAQSVTIENPHGMVMLSKDGKQWHVTLAPSSRMARRGATPEVLANGKTIIAYGYPKRDGTPEMRAEWIEVDGKRYQLR